MTSHVIILGFIERGKNDRKRELGCLRDEVLYVWGCNLKNLV